eukprot:206235_1
MKKKKKNPVQSKKIINIFSTFLFTTLSNSTQLKLNVRYTHSETQKQPNNHEQISKNNPKLRKIKKRIKIKKKKTTSNKKIINIFTTFLFTILSNKKQIKQNINRATNTIPIQLKIKMSEIDEITERQRENEELTILLNSSQVSNNTNGSIIDLCDNFDSSSHSNSENNMEEDSEEDTEEINPLNTNTNEETNQPNDSKIDHNPTITTDTNNIPSETTSTITTNTNNNTSSVVSNIPPANHGKEPTNMAPSKQIAENRKKMIKIMNKSVLLEKKIVTAQKSNKDLKRTISDLQELKQENDEAYINVCMTLQQKEADLCDISNTLKQ